MTAGLACYIVINRWLSYHYFFSQLTDLDSPQNQPLIQALLTNAFVETWWISALWSVLAGAMAVVGVSYWMAGRITQPLVQMCQVTQAFAAGQLESRMPESLIPEVDQLNRSFNRMALRLKEVEVKRSELIGNLAHELRTPLTIMRGYLEEWADGRITPTVQSFHQLIREVRRLERLVMDLQLLSKAETGHLPLNILALKVEELVQHIQDIFSTQLREDGPNLSFQVPSDLVAWADSDRTEQILVNLVGNAFRYTENGHIHVQSFRRQDQVWITVTDTGPGIAPQELPHVFERFWRSERSRRTHPDGSGLGLSITRRLIELQGGILEVKSQLGQGTEFSFSLPLAQPHFEHY